jgi:hypothetical protein
MHEFETERTSNDYVVAGQRARVRTEFGVLNCCQCCRLGVARDAWRACRIANGILFAMICIVLRLFRGTSVASQATRVYEHPEHLASSRIGRLMGSRCLTDASGDDTTVGRLEDDDCRDGAR